ncbi:iduronate 2-sulfatase [Ixodes scapularis]|uniref:iduronate 2-sulfatase n=1 Tax=Ixodes scapularis TaxID=6945 RepID=UPI001C38AAC9|nr:iduronate 2-sulfatase [Ixodes scapularis]XP_040075857.2 iduronate 2-sulfatase [Ixodes scapularis]XP_040075858.2 iduronate 2-sulfatase [Ixodes scapularis]XP_040075860.2 iduronate 2-sulfatase [Ixodes scapularis]
MRREIMAAVIAVVAFLLLSLGARGDKPPPNILFIVADDLRPTLGCYGDDLALTPAIDSLAQEGVLFANAHAQQALCGPSRTSFLTSRRPDSLRLYSNHGHYWRRAVGNFTSLPQYFKEHGYHTVSVGKVFHPGSMSGHHYDYPFSWSEEPYLPPSNKYENTKVCPDVDGNLEANLLCAVNVSSQPLGTLPDLESSQYATKFLRRWSSSDGRRGGARTPFFMAVGYHKPHIPFRIPQEYLGLYPMESMSLPPDHDRPTGLPDIAWNPWTDLRKRHDVALLNVSFPYGPMPFEFQKDIRRHYYAAVSYLDSQVSSLLDVLNETGLRRNTWVVFIGDHGWALGEHQEFSKYSNFRTATRVPFIVSPPPSSEPEVSFREPGYSRHGRSPVDTIVVQEPVSLLDLFPTLASLAGLPVPPDCGSPGASTETCTDGVNLDDAVRRHQVLTQYPRPSVEPQTNSDQPDAEDIRFMGYSVLSVDYRYTEWLGFNATTAYRNWTDLVARELYDLRKDPREDRNVADDPAYGNAVRTLSAELRRLVGSP